MRRKVLRNYLIDFIRLVIFTRAFVTESSKRGMIVIRNQSLQFVDISEGTFLFHKSMHLTSQSSNYALNIIARRFFLSGKMCAWDWIQIILNSMRCKIFASIRSYFTRRTQFSKAALERVQYIRARLIFQRVYPNVTRKHINYHQQILDTVVVLWMKSDIH